MGKTRRRPHSAAMFKQIDGLLGADALAELNDIAGRARFTDGRASNPHNTAKQNLQLHDPAAAGRAAKILADALYGSEAFRDFALPKVIAPPMIGLYRPGMRYGLHADSAFMQVGPRALRSDLSCTVFLSDPASYDGGALHIAQGDAALHFRLPAGSAIVYPSVTLHEVTPVTRGERRVGLTFIESRVADAHRRDMLYELNEVAALEGLAMDPANRARLQRVRDNLLRHWGDHD